MSAATRLAHVNYACGHYFLKQKKMFHAAGRVIHEMHRFFERKRFCWEYHHFLGQTGAPREQNDAQTESKNALQTRQNEFRTSNLVIKCAFHCSNL